MLIDTIKQDMIVAWKAKDILKKETLSFLISKVKNRGIELQTENVPDAEVLAIIQKMVKELNDEADSFCKADRHDKAAYIMQQIAYIYNYLPKQLTEDEIRAEIAKLEDKSIPNVMKYFKINYAGQVDMSKVSAIARGQ